MRYPEEALAPEAYARGRASDLGTITESLERRLVFELAGDVSGRDVLDIGCGYGDFALALRERGARVSGVDASHAMIEAARGLARSHGADIDFRTGNADRLPYPSETFEVVLAITVLCFVEDAASVFSEMARVLRPGRRLVIGELGRWSSWAAQRRLRAWLARGSGAPGASGPRATYAPSARKRVYKRAPFAGLSERSRSLFGP